MKETHDTRTELISTSRRNVLRGAGAVGAFSVLGIPAFSGTAAATTTTQTTTIRSGTGSTVTGYRVGTDSGIFPTSNPNTSANLTWVHPSWNDNLDHAFDAETNWIWYGDEISNTGQVVDGETTYYVREPVAGDVVELSETFTICGDPKSATLYITADNGYEVSLNGTLVGFGQVQDYNGVDWEDSDLADVYLDGSGGTWDTVETYDASSALVAGENVLTVLGGNTARPNGSVTSNPGGIIYEMDVEYVEGNCLECELDSSVKYEFACVETDSATGDCLAYDFVLEGEGDDDITYLGFTSKPDEAFEPMTATFDTAYVKLYAVVKTGSEIGVQELVADANGTVTVAAPGKHAISFVQFFCDETDADEAAASHGSNNGGDKDR
jgi:hypothetical protein